MDGTSLRSTGEIERFASHEGLEVRSCNVDDPDGSNRLLADLHVIRTCVSANESNASLFAWASRAFSSLENGPCDHRFSDHDVLDGDSGEIGHRDGVG